ncbi:MAG: hypothetical protein WCG42_09720 [Parachlamydiaceae bacterium]
MIKDEKTMCFLEEHVPELAEAAVKLAYWRSLAFGNSVLICKNDSLIRTNPDGTEEFIRKLLPSTPVTRGQILKIS